MDFSADVPLPGLVGHAPELGQPGVVGLPEPAEDFIVLHAAIIRAGRPPGRSKSFSRVAQSPAEGVGMKKTRSPSGRSFQPSRSRSGGYSRQRLLQVGIAEVHALDLRLAQVARGVGDREPPLGRAVDQVGGAVGRSWRSGVAAVELHDLGRAHVAVLADQGVHLRLLAEPLQARGDDHQLAAVGDRHARAVDRLVGHPGAGELVGLHHAHDLRDRLLQHGDVLLPRLPGGAEIRLQVVAHVEPGVDQLVLRALRARTTCT